MSNLSASPKPIGTQSTLFYPLTCDEWLRVSQNLKFAEIRVLYYLRALDPFGDRQLDLKVVEVAAATGLTKGTVSKSLKALACKEFIDLELVTVRVRLRSTVKLPVGNEVSWRKLDGSGGNSDVLQETSEFCGKPANPTGNIRPVKRRRGEGFRPLQTDQTDQSNQSLSDNPPPAPDEREEALLKFVAAQNKDARNPRAYALKCIQQSREFWESEFFKYTERIEGANLPPPAALTNENPLLMQLQAQWRRSDTASREAIAQAIERHPEWGLAVVEGAIVEAEP